MHFVNVGRILFFCALPTIPALCLKVRAILRDMRLT